MKALAIPSDRLTRLAMLGAALMLAYQVAGKAVRDSIFLSQFSPDQLPRMVTAAAVMAVTTGLASSRLLSRVGPARVVPALYGASCLLQFGEWLLLDYHPRAAAVLVYLHIVSLGSVLLSGFWSLMNEHYDPRAAKRSFGQIAGMGTLGGILGGLAAERVAAWLSSDSVLLYLALLHLLCAFALAAIARAAGKVRPAGMKEPRRESATIAAAFKRIPYLWGLAGLVVAGTASAAALDWVFKAQATAAIGKGPMLLRFFALFHTGTQILTFLVQTLATRWMLERAGLARTVATLPATVVCGSIGAIFAPQFAVTAVARSLEYLLRGSLFRSGYELFYTPVPAAEKRAAKSLIDVGVDRMGDAVGSGIVQIFLIAAPGGGAIRWILASSAVIAGLGLAVALWLQQAYVRVLESSLMKRAVELDLDEINDLTTRTVILQSAPVMTEVAQAIPPEPLKALARPSAPLTRRFNDPVVEALLELRSGDGSRVEAVLKRGGPLDPALVPQVISLLGWDATQNAARQSLAATGSGIVGQLLDGLLDPAQDFAIRRRIPPVLSALNSQRAVFGLMEGLKDTRFEVRYRCARALDAIVERNPELAPSAEVVFEAVERELAVNRTVWESHRLLDKREDTGFLDDVLRERANQSLEHVFSLLALRLSREPLKVAFRALHTDDPMLRGLALEYLDSSLPPTTRQRLSALVEQGPPRESRSAEEVIDLLLESNQSIVNQILSLRKA